MTLFPVPEFDPISSLLVPCQRCAFDLAVADA
jgi:hypothetical protein